MKLFAFIFVLGAFAEESLISGVELVACPTADGLYLHFGTEYLGSYFFFKIGLILQKF